MQGSLWGHTVPGSGIPSVLSCGVSCPGCPVLIEQMRLQPLPNTAVVACFPLPALRSVIFSIPQLSPWAQDARGTFLFPFLTRSALQCSAVILLLNYLFGVRKQ